MATSDLCHFPHQDALWAAPEAMLERKMRDLKRKIQGFGGSEVNQNCVTSRSKHRLVGVLSLLHRSRESHPL
jgi:hypothetical protein